MLEYMKNIVKLANAQLTIEERSLLSVAYKNLTGSLRNSWRIIVHIQELESSKATAKDKELGLIQLERSRIECEVRDTCEDVLNLLSKTLIPSARPGDETVFYYKM